MGKLQPRTKEHVYPWKPLNATRTTRAEGKTRRCIDVQTNGDRIPLYRSTESFLNNSRQPSLPYNLAPCECSHLTLRGHTRSTVEESTKGTSHPNQRAPFACDLSPKGYRRTLMAAANEDAPFLSNETFH